jgi:hypothetical protein
MTDCAIHALRIVTGSLLEDVLETAVKFGWSADQGMTMVGVWHAAKELGATVTQITAVELGQTLRKFVSNIDVSRNYIVSVRNHCFAIKGGVVYDKVSTKGQSRVFGFFEIR